MKQQVTDLFYRNFVTVEVAAQRFVYEHGGAGNMEC